MHADQLWQHIFCTGLQAHGLQILHGHLRTGLQVPCTTTGCGRSGRSQLRTPWHVSYIVTEPKEALCCQALLVHAEIARSGQSTFHLRLTTYGVEFGREMAFPYANAGSLVVRHLAVC
jgi:hypothetical protein